MLSLFGLVFTGRRFCAFAPFVHLCKVSNMVPHGQGVGERVLVQVFDVHAYLVWLYAVYHVSVAKPEESPQR